MVAVRRLGLLLLAYQIIMMCPYERKFCVKFFVDQALKVSKIQHILYLLEMPINTPKFGIWNNGSC